jgi:hypothetical protein
VLLLEALSVQQADAEPDEKVGQKPGFCKVDDHAHGYRYQQKAPSAAG